LHAASKLIICNACEACGATVAWLWPAAWEDRQGQILRAMVEHFMLCPDCCSENVTATPEVTCLTAYKTKVRVVMVQDSVAFSVL